MERLLVVEEQQWRLRKSSTWGLRRAAAGRRRPWWGVAAGKVEEEEQQRPDASEIQQQATEGMARGGVVACGGGLWGRGGAPPRLAWPRRRPVVEMELGIWGGKPGLRCDGSCWPLFLPDLICTFFILLPLLSWFLPKKIPAVFCSGPNSPRVYFQQILAQLLV